MSSRIRKGDRVRISGDISRKGTVRRMLYKATVARIKWDLGKPRRSEHRVGTLERIKRKGEPKHGIKL